MPSTNTNDTTSRSSSDNSCDNNHLSQIKKRKIVLLLMAMHAANFCLNHVVKSPCRTSELTGHEWIQEIIHGKDNHCYEILRMRKHAFYNYAMFWSKIMVYSHKRCDNS